MIDLHPRGMTTNQWFAEIRRIKKVRGHHRGRKRRDMDRTSYRPMVDPMSFFPVAMAYLGGLFRRSAK